ncbi:MAG: hypothetical protein PUD20_07765 [bacterium]|nr:hypothetical protein [bacterium]
MEKIKGNQYELLYDCNQMLMVRLLFCFITEPSAHTVMKTSKELLFS